MEQKEDDTQNDELPQEATEARNKAERNWQAILRRREAPDHAPFSSEEKQAFDDHLRSTQIPLEDIPKGEFQTVPVTKAFLKKCAPFYTFINRETGVIRDVEFRSKVKDYYNHPDLDV